MNNAIELSPELSLIKHTPANNAWFLEHVKVTEIYDEWEKQWVTVEWIQEHYPYFVNQVLGNMSKHPHIDAFRKLYGIYRTHFYSIVHDGVYIWRMTEYQYYKNSSYRNRLWGRGLSIIPAFQNKWHATRLTALWLEYLHTERSIEGVYVSCDEDNEKSLAIARKFWKRVPENDYIWLDGGKKKRLVFYYSSHPELIEK